MNQKKVFFSNSDNLTKYEERGRIRKNIRVKKRTERRVRGHQEIEAHSWMVVRSEIEIEEGLGAR